MSILTPREQEFYIAAQQMIGRRFSDIHEAREVLCAARASMKNLDRTARKLADAINKAYWGRIRRGASPEARLLQRAYKEIGLDVGVVTKNLKWKKELNPLVESP